MQDLVTSLAAKAKGLARAAKVANKGWAGLEAPNYVHNGAVLCKRCGCTISEIAPGPNFMELRLLFNDASAHVTPCCRKCATGLTLVQLEAIYCADLVVLAEDEEAQGRLMHWELLADRQVTGYERV